MSEQTNEAVLTQTDWPAVADRPKAIHVGGTADSELTATSLLNECSFSIIYRP